MTVEERKNIILAKIEEMKSSGEDKENALNKLGVTLDENMD